MTRRSSCRYYLGILVIILVASSPAAADKKTPDNWIRVSQLGPTPKPITDAWPLSDQSNKAGWEKYELLSDEFKATELDPNKWWPKNPGWLGRQPAFFYPGNVDVSDGKLHLTMRKQEVAQRPKDKGYYTYTSAAVQSKTRVKYGYFEIKARSMRSHGSSSFWFYNITPEWWTEIDVFEIGGGAPGFEKKYNMNVHVFRTPTDKQHWSAAGVWAADSNLADDYHVYGLEWDKEKIKWYFDGVLVRWVENTHWHQPLTLNFDSETMPEWFGLPRDSDLPSTYSVEYVRAWKKGEDGIRPLFLDTGFRRGFLLSYPDPARARAVESVLNLGDDNNEPIWRLCQWGTKYSLAGSPRIHHSNGDMSYRNEGKEVLVGAPDSQNRDLILEVRATAEYGDRARKYGESWPHLLVEQDAAAIYALVDLEKVQLKISLKLLFFKDGMNKVEYDPNLHAAQFQMFFVVKNINQSSPDLGNYFWFGVPFFDNRHAIPPSYAAKDTGHKNSTNKFIYTIDGREVHVTPLQTGSWVAMEKDLLPYIKSGLACAVETGYLSSPDPRDYAVANMNIGWEVPGTFDVSMQIRDLSINAVLKGNNDVSIQADR
jgi:hypothetical protein